MSYVVSFHVQNVGQEIGVKQQKKSKLANREGRKLVRAYKMVFVCFKTHFTAIRVLMRAKGRVYSKGREGGALYGNLGK